MPGVRYFAGSLRAREVDPVDDGRDDGDDRRDEPLAAPDEHEDGVDRDRVDDAERERS